MKAGASLSPGGVGGKVLHVMGRMVSVAGTSAAANWRSWNLGSAPPTSVTHRASFLLMAFQREGSQVCEEDSPGLSNWPEAGGRFTSQAAEKDCTITRF